MHTHNDVRELERTPFNFYESLIIPITTYLREQGVEFRFNVMITDLKSYPSSDPTTISEIVLQENGHELLITVDPIDIVIVTLGSVASGMQTGSNSDAPSPPLPPNNLKHGEWSLWQKLEKQSLKFGNPSNFSTRLEESQIETFTVTLRDSDFMQYYSKLTGDKPGTGALLTVMESPWGLNISVPRQPVFATQPKNVHVIWGYALHPERKGKYIEKTMLTCSGEEIFRELLSHLDFPTDTLLSSSITIPCIMPLGTSMLLSRSHNDRPHVNPHETTNLGLIGQYVELPGDAACSIEYSIRGAQMAVCNLMTLPHGPPKLGKNELLEVFELLL
jgi:oleate hydratase